MKKILYLLLIASALLVVGCSSQDPVSLQQKWSEKLDSYRAQIDEAEAQVEGVKDFSDVLGPGKSEVHGDGTFIGQGTGMATLLGVGIVTGEVDGTVIIQGTHDVDISGFEYIGNTGNGDEYRGKGYFTATSDYAQHIEVIVDGNGWVIGAGTGIVFYAGEGFAFWY